MLSVLFGAVVTLAAAWGCGHLLLVRLRLPLTRAEHSLYALFLGAPVLSLLLFWLAACGWVYDASLLALAALITAAVWRWGRGADYAPALPALPRMWRWLFPALWTPFALIALLHALAPEMSPDGSSYHLGVIARFYRAHGFVPLPYQMYGQMPQGFDILYLMAFAFGRHSAAALVHCGFLLTMPWLALRIGQRAGAPAAGAAAGLLVLLSPVVLIDGASAYNDVALAATLLAAFGLTRLPATPPLPLGLLAGYALTIKYTAAPALLWALAYLAFRHRFAWRPLALCSAGAAAVIAPWLARNWLTYGNPVAPFFSRWFPNPWMHESFEISYRAWMRWYDGLEHIGQLPWALTVDGGILGGLLGPVFLLTPLALLALRTPFGRHVLLAAALFALPYAANVGTRFLIPPLPFLALALALALPARGLPVLVLLHAAVSLPPVVNRYAGEHAWRIKELYPRAALRLDDPKAFMTREWPPYHRAALIESATPADAVVLVASPIPESYTSRETRVLYLGAYGERIADLLITPLVREHQPLHRYQFSFPAQPLTALRVMQTASNPTDIWSISGVRLTGPAGPVAASPKWRLRASAFPWDLPFAFDGNPATRWRTWRPLQSGEWIEIEFPEPLTLSAAALDMAPDQWSVRMELEGRGPDGRWQRLSAEPVRTERPPPLGLRRRAIEEIKRSGATHLLAVEGDFGWNDFRDNEDLWGIREAGRAGNARLYRLE